VSVAETSSDSGIVVAEVDVGDDMLCIIYVKSRSLALSQMLANVVLLVR